MYQALEQDGGKMKLGLLDLHCVGPSAFSQKINTVAWEATWNLRTTVTDIEQSGRSGFFLTHPFEELILHQAY